MRFNKRYIWQRFITFLPASLLLIFLLIDFALVTEDEESFYTGFLGINSMKELIIASVIVFLCYSVIDYIYSYLYWRLTKYEIKDREITLQKGVLFKKNIVIEFNNIHAVNVDRKLMCLILGLSKLCIDSGNARTSFINEIEIFDTPDVIAKLEETIKGKMNGETLNKENNEDESITTIEEIKHLDYEYKSKKQRKSIVLSLPVWIGVFFLLLFFVSMLIVNGIVEEEDKIPSLIFILLPIFVLLAIYGISRIAYALIYHNFRISYDDYRIIIEYGLLHQRRYIIDKAKIKGLVFNQDFIQKAFKFGGVEIHMVGLVEDQGDNQGQFVRLLPYVDIDILNNILEELGLNERFKTTSSTCRKNSFIYFIALPLIILFITILPFVISFLFMDYLISLIIILGYILIGIIIILISLLRKNNQSIDFNNDYLFISNGSLVKYSYIIPWKSVVSLSTRGTIIREKNNITSIIVDYYSSKQKTKQIVLMQDIKSYGEILLYFESIKNK